MLCPAAVSAAAAAVWLLAVLGTGLSLPAEDNAEPGFTLCSHCFYRQMPPQGASAGPLLRPLCHRLPGGQAFATLSRPTCDTAVYSAFHLSHGWTERKGEEGEVTEEGEVSIKVAVPALLGGGGDLSHPVSLTDSPLQHWDSTVTMLVQSSIAPQCSMLGGDLYILTGAGGLGGAEDGDEECQTKPLWSAVCCAVPEGKGGFSVGLIRETGEQERQVSVKELEEMIGATELFSEGCGGAEEETAGINVGLHSEGLPGSTEQMEADVTDEETGDTEVDSDTTDQDANEEVTESREASVTQEQVASVDAQSEEADAADVAEETSADSTSADSTTSESSSEKQRDAAHSGAVRSESPDSSDDYETVDEQETETQETSADSKSSESSTDKHRDAAHSESSGDAETVDEREVDSNSSSTLVYILSTTLSIIKAPLRPVFSTITQLPGQVTYVLQEDLGVLSALPGDTFSFFHLLTSDLLSWMGSAGDVVLGIGETGFCSAYYCTSSMLGALLNSCHAGVTGMGTLAGDTVGIFRGALDNAWWVTKFFGGRLWDQSEGYVGTVVSEMGGQAQAVGGGLGRLVWRSGSVVGKVFRLGGGLIMGMLDVVISGGREAFGQESE